MKLFAGAFIIRAKSSGPGGGHGRGGVKEAENRWVAACDSCLSGGMSTTVTAALLLRGTYVFLCLGRGWLLVGCSGWMERSSGLEGGGQSALAAAWSTTVTTAFS